MIGQAEVNILSTLLKRDVSKDLNLLFNLRDAIGEAISKEDQKFVSNNLYNGLKFLRASEGKKALQDLVKVWRAYVNGPETSQATESGKAQS